MKNIVYIIGAMMFVAIAVACYFILPTDGMRLSKARELCLENRYGEACAIYKELAKDGNAEGIFHLAEAYRKGRGIERSDSLAWKYLKQSAELGFDDAKATVAISYVNGNFNQKKDEKKGLALLSKIYATSKSDRVKFLYAYYTFLYGKIKTEPSCETGLGIIYTLSESKDPTVLRCVGIIYESDKCDYGKAIECYKKAYEKGDSDSAYRIARLCSDKKKKVEWLKKGIDCMIPECMITYGDICTDDNKENKEYYNPSLGITMYLKAARLNSGYAYYKLGHAYSFGISVDIDYAKAVECFKKAMERGNAEGTYNYAISLLKGRGCTQDVSRAKKIMQLAEDRGSSGAAEWLVEQSLRDKLSDSIIRKHLDRAVKLRNVGAQYFLALCYESGMHSYPKDEQIAFSYFKKAADSGFVDAYMKVAKCYRNGFGTQVDNKKAKEYENMANKR